MPDYIGYRERELVFSDAAWVTVIEIEGERTDFSDAARVTVIELEGEGTDFI